LRVDTRYLSVSTVFSRVSRPRPWSDDGIEDCDDDDDTVDVDADVDDTVDDVDVVPDATLFWTSLHW
jgi:hypothetical protein